MKYFADNAFRRRLIYFMSVNTVNTAEYKILIILLFAIKTFRQNSIHSILKILSQKGVSPRSCKCLRFPE